MSAGTNAARAVAAVLAASAIAAPLIVKWEGWENRPYRDVVGVGTACAGAIKGVNAGKIYSDRECMDLLARDVTSHAMEIDRCIKTPIPPETRAAFISFAYNVGAANFCSSTLAKRLNAGDVRGACAELSKWVFAGGKRLPGLVSRRAEERAYCERGLK